MNKLKETISYLKLKGVTEPKVGLVLGSGLGGLIDLVTDKIEIPYAEIPHFPVTNVSGHKGALVYGTILNTKVLIMAGRFHHYEGFSQREVVYPIYAMKQLGIDTLFLTNACGGINESLSPGSIMLIEDFINLMGTNPLIGENIDELGTRFPDMTDPYPIELRTLAKEVSRQINIPIFEGVYAGFMGPYYETRAEIRMIRTLGADAVGMSTVPETIAANHAGMKTLGFSMITNMATGIQTKKHSHAHVVEVATKAGKELSTLILEILREMENRHVI